MTSASIVFPPDTAERDDAPERVRPARARHGPVLIGDAATAADHATLLLALWRRWDEAD